MSRGSSAIDRVSLLLCFHSFHLSVRLHRRMVASVDAVAITWSDGEKATAHTPRRWPRKTPSSRRSLLSQICPTRRKTMVTRNQSPSSMTTRSSSSTSETLAVLSCDPVAMNLSLGATATALMSLSCATAVQATDSVAGAAASAATLRRHTCEPASKLGQSRAKLARNPSQCMALVSLAFE